MNPNDAMTYLIQASLKTCGDFHMENTVGANQDLHYPHKIYFKKPCLQMLHKQSLKNLEF